MIHYDINQGINSLSQPAGKSRHYYHGGNHKSRCWVTCKDISPLAKISRVQLHFMRIDYKRPTILPWPVNPPMVNTRIQAISGWLKLPYHSSDAAVRLLVFIQSLWIPVRPYYSLVSSLWIHILIHINPSQSLLIHINPYFITIHNYS